MVNIAVYYYVLLNLNAHTVNKKKNTVSFSV